MSPSRLAVVFLPLLILAAGSARPADDEPEAAVQKELKRLEGKWKLVIMVSHGKALPEERTRRLYAVIQGDRLEQWFEGEAKPRAALKIKLDPAAKPPAIDLSSEGPAERVLSTGIYQIEGDRLTICYVNPIDARPAAFASEAKSRTTLIVHEREKP